MHFYGSQGTSCHCLLIFSPSSLWTRQHNLHPDKSLDPVDWVNPFPFSTPTECLSCGMHVLLTQSKPAVQWKQRLCYAMQASSQALLRLSSRKMFYLIHNIVSCTHFCINKINPRQNLKISIHFSWSYTTDKRCFLNQRFFSSCCKAYK